MKTHTTTIRCGETLHVLVASGPEELAALVEQTAAKLLRPNGHAVVLANGESSHIVDEEIHPTQWHEDGNRVLANRVLHSSTGRTVLKTVWVRP